MEEWVKKGIPPMGEEFQLKVPQILTNSLLHLNQMMKSGIADLAKNMTEDALAAYKKDKVPEIGARTIKFMTDGYISARDEVQKDADAMKAFFKSQDANKWKGKTKADVLKSIWAEVPKWAPGSTAPPLDEEMLAELAEEPAVEEGEFRHSWGIADKLYKSEAIDAFGSKYLLGVYETKEQAQKAFDDWNAEYEQSRQELKDELQQWSKT